jgi:hypothetical protein
VSTISSIFSIVAGELEVIWSVASFSKASVDLADVDGGIDVTVPMFSRTDFRLSTTFVAFETFENAVNGSFGVHQRPTFEEQPPPTYLLPELRLLFSIFILCKRYT